MLRRRFRLALVAMLLLPASACAQRSAVRGEQCIVGQVVDGDTFRCRDGTRVRLLLIDAPERGQQPFEQQATARLRALLPVGTVARLESDVRTHDQFERRLAYVYDSSGGMVNEAMVRDGFALVLVYQPNVKYVERLRAAAAEARRERRGLWSTSGFECTPRDRRRRAC